MDMLWQKQPFIKMQETAGQQHVINNKFREFCPYCMRLAIGK
jgi:hypothetical protein